MTWKNLVAMFMTTDGGDLSRHCRYTTLYEDLCM